MRTANDPALLSVMLRARRFDEHLCEQSELALDTIHLSIGLEATCGAVALARRDGDTLALTHRNHGQLAAIGADLKDMYCEIFAREGSFQHGRAGSFHLADPRRGVAYTSAMLGGGIPVAVGLAAAHHRDGSGHVTFCCFGDEAMEEGVAHESLNLARHWQAPVVFLCEDNESSNAGALRDRPTRARFGTFAEANAITTDAADAGDPWHLFSVVESATERARSGGGPQFVQLVSRPFPRVRRGTNPDASVGRFDLATALSGGGDAWDKIDPIGIEARRLLLAGVSAHDLAALDAAIDHAVRADLEAALNQPPVDPRHALSDVLALRAMANGGPE